MLEIAMGFETKAAEFGAASVVVPAVAIVAAGLVAWLAALALRRQLSAAAGAIAGAFFGFFVFGGNPLATIGSSIVAAFLAASFDGAFGVVFSAALAGTAAITVLAAFGAGTAGTVDGEGTPPVREGIVTIRPAPDTVIEYAAAMAAETANRWKRLPLNGRVAAAAISGAFAAAAIFLGRFISAVCWSSLGTALVFIGMIMLLAYKGSNPVSHICARGAFYAAVFAAMAGFGTVEQLVLCTGRKNKPKKKTE
jgi:hypothetical protein